LILPPAHYRPKCSRPAPLPHVMSWTPALQLSPAHTPSREAGSSGKLCEGSGGREPDGKRGVPGGGAEAQLAMQLRRAAPPPPGPCADPPSKLRPALPPDSGGGAGLRDGTFLGGAGQGDGTFWGGAGLGDGFCAAPDPPLRLHAPPFHGNRNPELRVTAWEGDHRASPRTQTI
jgi:hypothetical protein